MAVKKKNSASTIVNRKARFDYELGDDLIVGMSLNGKQVRAARDRRVQLQGAFVREKDGSLFLTGATFTVKADKGESVADVSDIQLLATKRQIREFLTAKTRGFSIVATKLLTEGRFVKLVIALGKGKREWDKRETIRRRDLEREHNRMMK